MEVKKFEIQLKQLQQKHLNCFLLISLYYNNLVTIHYLKVVIDFNQCLRQLPEPFLPSNNTGNLQQLFDACIERKIDIG